MKKDPRRQGFEGSRQRYAEIGRPVSGNDITYRRWLAMVERWGTENRILKTD
jgi:hypothetical protein